MDAISQLLAGLGPWGVVAGIALAVGGQWIRNRMQPTVPPTPAAPEPPVLTPLPRVPQPVAPPQSSTPVIDAVLAFVRLQLLHKAATSATPTLTVGTPQPQPQPVVQPGSGDLDHPSAAEVLSKLLGK